MAGKVLVKTALKGAVKTASRGAKVVENGKKLRDDDNDGDDDGYDALDDVVEHHGLTMKEEEERENRKHASHSEYYSSASVGPSRRSFASAPPRNRCSKQEFKEITKDIHKIVFQDGCCAIEDRDDLKLLIKMLSVHVEVQEGEVDWIFAVVDKDHTHRIEEGQLMDVNQAINRWLSAKEKVDEIMKKYDTDNMGCLNREQVRLMLIDLNDGLHVDDKQLGEVIRNSSKYRPGSLFIPEIKEAMAFWYSHVKPQGSLKDTIGNDHSKGGAVGRAHTSLHRIHTASASQQMNDSNMMSCALDEKVGAAPISHHVHHDYQSAKGERDSDKHTGHHHQHHRTDSATCEESIQQGRTQCPNASENDMHKHHPHHHHHEETTTRSPHAMAK
eukprot:gnl/MRDRNA2_/MRDRNA2_72681_c0_seq1.p1 gnl/MRDRNA2_/MRDRNA2_72681_c0~~gnl/MRDRNA2_/MRDRNA2_72681_c0_seq1.p1  ORF type:complete len:386 (+),score=73.91 gnl/MRDRNA2_/MRDRNA2_72681_c0_seq1:165-1322(+)